MKNQAKIIRKITSILFAAFLVLIISVPAFAGSEGLSFLSDDSDTLGVSISHAAYNDLKYIEVTFPTVYGESSTWEFPYSDDFFSGPDNVYSHIMAQGSFGMTFAAFRSSELNNNNSGNIKKYFDSIGFENMYADSYNNTPTADSITFALASKKIGNQTVIASICCGSGYGAEWSGNLTIGTGTRHEGFDKAARTVESAIEDYIEKYNIQGKISLWTSGYSRAAAVANVVAADMTDSKTFQKVFAYCFATPRTTKEPGYYDNIFNIVGKDDPVPQIPFADWGFDRYGIELYTPTVETDSDFALKEEKVSEVMQQIDGHKYMYNPEISSQFRTVFDYLLNLMPEPEDYTNNLQPGVLSVMANSNNDNILALATRVISTFSPKTTQESEELNSLIDYIQQLANQYVLKGNSSQISAGMWDSNLTVTQNLTTEHNPDKYLAWMFSSDNPEDIFGQSITYVHFTVKGNVLLHLFADDGYVETIDGNGNITYENPYEGDHEVSECVPDLYVEAGNGQINITIPGDRDYLVTVESKTDQELEYYATGHCSAIVKSVIENIYSLKAEANKFYHMYFDSGIQLWIDTINTDAGASEVWSGTTLYSPSAIMKLQNINVLHLTLKEILIFGAVLAIFAYTELIVCVVLAMVRVFAGHQRRSASTIVVHSVNAAIFLALEVAMWYFVPAYPIAKLVAKLISFIFIFSLAVVALTEYFKKRNILLTAGVFAGMLFSLIFENMLIPSVSRTSILYKILFYALLCVAAALTWIGHTRRRAFKIAKIEARRHERQIAAAEQDIARAYAKQERATQRYVEKQKRLKARAEKKAQKSSAASRDTED